MPPQSGSPRWRGGGGRRAPRRSRRGPGRGSRRTPGGCRCRCRRRSGSSPGSRGSRRRRTALGGVDEQGVEDGATRRVQRIHAGGRLSATGRAPPVVERHPAHRRRAGRGPGPAAPAPQLEDATAHQRVGGQGVRARRARSTTSTRRPARASSSAVEAPATRAPTTTASQPVVRRRARSAGGGCAVMSDLLSVGRCGPARAAGSCAASGVRDVDRTSVPLVEHVVDRRAAAGLLDQRGAALRRGVALDVEVHPDLPVAVADLVGQPEDAEQVDVALDGRGDPVQRDPAGGGDVGEPEVRQAAMACSRNSTGVGPWFVPTSTAGWSASYANGSVRWCPPARRRRSPGWSDRLWVPLIQSLRARNWNWAISGVRLHGVEGGEQRRDVDAVAGGGSRWWSWTCSSTVLVERVDPAADSPPVEVRRAATGRHIRAQHGSRTPVPSTDGLVVLSAYRDRSGGTTLNGVTTVGPAKGPR